MANILGFWSSKYTKLESFVVGSMGVCGCVIQAHVPRYLGSFSSKFSNKCLAICIKIGRRNTCIVTWHAWALGKRGPLVGGRITA